MKYLFILFILILTQSIKASTIRIILLERVTDSQGVLVKYTATAYIQGNDGLPVVKDLKTAAQLLKLAKIININNFTKKVSKTAGRIWIFFNEDGTLNKIDQHALNPFEQAPNMQSEIDSATSDDISALKTYAEGLIP